MGIPSVIDIVRRCGIRSPIDPYPSLALGTSPVTLLEMTSAYAVFASGGQRVEPLFIHRVVDRDGQVLLENLRLESPPAPGGAPAPPPDADRQVLDPAHAFLVTDLLRAPVEHGGGTAGRARVLGRPLAGKTGTTNDQGDTWFVGFSADVAAGVWMGFDARQVLGARETGGPSALPVWIEFMQAAHADRPVRDFPVPEGVSYARIDPSTGKLTGEGGGAFQAFLSGSEPRESVGSPAEEEQTRRMLRMDF